MRVVIGTDPHRRSATIEVRDEREILLATGRFGMDRAGYRQLLGYVRQWPGRIWAVEGANGRYEGVIAPFGWIVGIVALVAGGYYLIVHAISGPHVFHFEIVGIGVGLALLWDRITGRPPVHHPTGRTPGLGRTTTATVTGTGLLLAVFGISPAPAAGPRCPPARAG